MKFLKPSNALYLNLGLGVCLALGIIAVYIAQPKFFKHLDLKIYDDYLRALPQETASPIPVIVDIDERSLTSYGQWPWPRYRLAALVDKISHAGAAAIALDILLAEPDRTSPARLREQLQRDFGLSISFSGLPSGIDDNDVILTHVLQKSRTVLGCYFNFNLAEPPQAQHLPSSGIVELGGPDAQPAATLVPHAYSVILPLPQFSAASSVAFYNVITDPDGLVRRAPLMLAADASLYPSLALKSLMTAFGEDTLLVRTNQDGMTSIACGEFVIPVSPDGSMPVLFRGAAGMYTQISATDILEDNATIDLAGKIVFIGTSAAGLRDIRATPFDQHYPGVEVHATIIDAITSQRFIQVPSWTPGIHVIGIMLTALVCMLCFGLARASVYVPVGVCLSAGYWFGGSALFQSGYFISPLYLLLAIGLEGFSLLTLRFWQEERQKKLIHQSFSRYVAPEIVNRIVADNRGAAALAGEDRIVTLLFTDIRGFTSLSERLTPHQVVSLLNLYFTPMTALVRGSHGTIDKFIGDAIMAFWNAPLDVHDHALQAVRVALRMHAALDKLNQHLEQEFGLSLNIGAGIHTGRAFVGNMGTNELLSYTAIGDNVNLASRLEGLCPVYGVRVVVSQETRDLCGDTLAWQLLDIVRVKGRAHPVAMYTPLELEAARDRSRELSDHHNAVMTYMQGNFTTALAAFATLNKKHPNALYQLFEQRCSLLISNPPQEWEGVWTLTSK